jgi:hypothetical protein
LRAIELSFFEFYELYGLVDLKDSAEVGQDQLPTLVEKHICWLDISVNIVEFTQIGKYRYDLRHIINLDVNCLYFYNDRIIIRPTYFGSAKTTKSHGAERSP